MTRYIISPEATAKDWFPVALCIHELLNRLPVTARSRDHPGVRIEHSRLVDDRYTGPVLEEVLRTNRLVRTTPSSGSYKGVPVVVSPLQDEDGKAIGVIGVVDITGIFDLATLMEHQSAILKQVCGKDPCPLPTELVSGKR